MTANDIVLKTKLLYDYLFFVRYFFKRQYGFNFVVSQHHQELAHKVYDIVSGKTTRLIINIPPRYSKTEFFVKGFIAWCIANNPKAKFIHLSYSADLALDNSTAVRDLIKHDEFQRIFNIELKKDSDSKKKWYTADRGGVYATAAGGQITGFGAGMIEREMLGTGSPADGFGGAIIIDDPLKPDDAFSKLKRDVINRRYNNTIRNRVNSENTPIIVIMQRLHVDDMSGYLLNGGSGDRWEHVCMPAINPDGSALWERKHTVAELRMLETVDPYTFASQYMQSPIALGGNLFKSEWWQYYDILPQIKKRIIFADTAQKTNNWNDYSVFQCWGESMNGDLYLIDQIRGRWESPELKVRARAFWEKHKSMTAAHGLGNLIAAKVEDKSSGTDVIQNLGREGIPIIGIQRDRDKVARAMDVLPYIASGHVYLPRKAPFLSDYISEHEQFPNGTHDDQVDPTIDAITDILMGEYNPAPAAAATGTRSANNFNSFVNKSAFRGY